MESNMQPTLATNAFAKVGILFKPHPPSPLENVILSHLSHGKTLPSLLPIHKKNLRNFQMEFNIPTRIEDRDI